MNIQGKKLFLSACLLSAILSNSEKGMAQSCTSDTICYQQYYPTGSFTETCTEYKPFVVSCNQGKCLLTAWCDDGTGKGNYINSSMPNYYTDCTAQNNDIGNGNGQLVCIISGKKAPIHRKK